MPESRKQFITTNNDLPTRCDASGSVLGSACNVLLRVRFGKVLYRVTFIVLENMSCPVLVGTKLLNRHVDSIRCRKGIVELTCDNIPILGHHCSGALWRNPDKNFLEYHEYATLEDGSKVRTGVDNGLTSIRLASSCVLQPNSQTQFLVTSRMKGIIVTETNGSLSFKYGIRAMNIFHEVQEH